MSEKFIIKFFNMTLQPETESWIRTWLRWWIDSSYRTQKRVDLFLKKQLNTYYPMLEELALSLRILKKGKLDDDATIVNILKYVTNKVKYVTDKKNFGKVEYWATAEETLEKGKDDCDGINGAIYILARLAGISSLKMYCALGDTTSGYHFWIMYFSTKRDRWFSIDGTFYPNFNELKRRNQFITHPTKYKSLDYMFTEDYCFRKK